MIMSSTYNICEICAQPRSKKIHSKCSRILQKRARSREYQEEISTVRKNYRAEELVDTVTTTRLAKIRRASQEK